MENNAAMRWDWPFEPRASDDRNGEDNHLGDACPDFLCVGAQKGGTSWLFHLLTLHPLFWMPPIKELHYLDMLSRVKRRNPRRCNDEVDQCFLARLVELSALPHLDLGTYSQLFAPKAALLSGDEGKKETVPKTGAQITLSFDYRSIDGGGAGRMLKRIAGRPQETVIPAA
jgi:hypothetical protein